MKSKISIIIPVFNAEKHLKRCLDSLLIQTYENLEIILVNDGSTDSSLEICTNYSKIDSRILLIDQENKGCANARNKALEIVTGEFIGFVDSDDWVEPNMFEKLLETALKFKSQLTICNVFLTSKRKIKKHGKHEIQLLDKSGILFNYLNEGFYIVKNIYSRELLEKVKFREGVYITSDVIFGVDIIELVDRAVHINTPLYSYFVGNNDSITRNTYDERKFVNLEVNLYLQKKVESIFKSNPDIKEMVRLRLMKNIVYHFTKTYEVNDLNPTETLLFRKKLKEVMKYNYSYKKDKSINIFAMRFLPIFLINPYFKIKNSLIKLKR